MNKKIAKLEKEMETLREQIDAFDGQIAQCHPGNYSELTKLSQSRDALSAKLEEQENLWLELNS